VYLAHSIAPNLRFPRNDTGIRWRKRVGVEPTGDRIACHPPVLKTGTITGPHALPQRHNQRPRIEGLHRNGWALDSSQSAKIRAIRGRF